MLQDFMQNLILTFVPTTTKINNSSPPWSDKTVRSLINRKKKAYNRLKKHPIPSNVTLYKAARNAAVNGIRQARKIYESNLIAKSKKHPKLLFSYINRNKKTATANCIKNPNGSILCDDGDIATAFNDNFVSILKPTALSPPPPASPSNNRRPTFTIQDVENEFLARSYCLWSGWPFSCVFKELCFFSRSSFFSYFQHFHSHMCFSNFLERRQYHTHP